MITATHLQLMTEDQLKEYRGLIKERRKASAEIIKHAEASLEALKKLIEDAKDGRYTDLCILEEIDIQLEGREQ